METKHRCKYFNSRLNVVFFSRKIDIGKITAEKKHKFFVDVEAGGCRIL